MKWPPFLIISLISLSHFSLGWVRADRQEIEDRSSHYNGPPLYRYYDKLPVRTRSPHRKYDANTYWGGRYYGNDPPDPVDDYHLNKQILEFEMEQEKKASEPASRLPDKPDIDQEKDPYPR